MIESATRIPAGDEHAGQACGWCAAALEAEDAAAVCAECASLHHEACWDRELGCSRAGCLNAPLTRLDAAEPQKPDDDTAPARKKKARKKPRTSKPCVGCNAELPMHVEVCDDCLAINTPDGLYHGPTKTFTPARDALILAIVGLFICGPVAGPMAISRGNKALEPIRRDPRLSGEGLAIAAMVIGALDLLFWLIAIASSAGGHR
jgi:hypothetical protein